MIVQEHFGWHDNVGKWREVAQVWAQVPGTGVWFIVEAEPLPVDPATAPVQPTRPN